MHIFLYMSPFYVDENILKQTVCLCVDYGQTDGQTALERSAEKNTFVWGHKLKSSRSFMAFYLAAKNVANTINEYINGHTQTLTYIHLSNYNLLLMHVCVNNCI